jgi:hypothetical protein
MVVYAASGFTAAFASGVAEATANAAKSVTGRETGAIHLWILAATARRASCVRDHAHSSATRLMVTEWTVWGFGAPIPLPTPDGPP